MIHSAGLGFKPICLVMRNMALHIVMAPNIAFQHFQVGLKFLNFPYHTASAFCCIMLYQIAISTFWKPLYNIKNLNKIKIVLCNIYLQVIQYFSHYKVAYGPAYEVLVKPHPLSSHILQLHEGHFFYEHRQLTEWLCANCIRQRPKYPFQKPNMHSDGHNTSLLSLKQGGSKPNSHKGQKYTQ